MKNLVILFVITLCIVFQCMMCLARPTSKTFPSSAYQKKGVVYSAQDHLIKKSSGKEIKKPFDPTWRFGDGPATVSATRCNNYDNGNEVVR